MGRSRTNKIVYMNGDQEMVGEIVDVKIDNARTWSLEGKIIH